MKNKNERFIFMTESRLVSEWEKFFRVSHVAAVSSAKIVNAGASRRKGQERGLSSLLTEYSLLLADIPKGLENISLEKDGINTLCPLIGQCVAQSLGGGID